MSKAKKLKSGSWQVRVYDYTDEKGVAHSRSFTAPTKLEAEVMAAEYRADRATGRKIAPYRTVTETIDKYIELSELLSPTTLHRYRRMQEFAFPGIMQRKVNTLTDADMQAAINLETRRRSERTGKQISPKTVKNEWGLIAASIKAIYGKTYNVKLPKVVRQIEELPPPEAVLDAIAGTNIELPCLLAMWLSLRMSEIRGIKCSAIRGGYLYIERVLVDVGSTPVEKAEAKTSASRRRLRIPAHLMELIEAQPSYMNWKAHKIDGFLVTMTRNQIAHYYRDIMKASNLELTFHDLRHLFASISLNILQLPSKSVQLSGGWSNATVLDRVYSQSFAKLQSDADDKRDAYFTERLASHPCTAESKTQ